MVPDGTPNSNGLSSSVLLKRPERGGKHPISRQSQISYSSWVAGHVVLLFPRSISPFFYWYVEVPQSAGAQLNHRWKFMDPYLGHRASGSCSWRVTRRTSCRGPGVEKSGCSVLGPSNDKGDFTRQKKGIWLGKMVRQPSNSSNYIKCWVTSK